MLNFFLQFAVDAKGGQVDIYRFLIGIERENGNDSAYSPD